MLTALTRNEIRQAELNAINGGITEIDLIERAGCALFNCANFVDKKIVVFCGSGKNGADGLALACNLTREGRDVSVIFVFDKICDEGKYFFDKYVKLQGKYKKYVEQEKIDADIVVDCIFGTGLNKIVEGVASSAINEINSSNAFVISADIPSGLDADSGDVLGVAVKADLTVSFSQCKVGYEFGFGRDFVGKVVYGDMPIPMFNGKVNFLDESDIVLKRRSINIHKGTAGRVYIIAGSPTFIGAAILAERAACAALKSGAGLVTLVVPHSLKEVYQKRVTECTLSFLPDNEGSILFDKYMLDKIIEKADAICIGMGLGTNPELSMTVQYLIDNFNKPLIIDADAINCLSGIRVKFKPNVILTPHVKEFERLLGRKILNPIEDGKSFTKTNNVNLHLKSTCSLTFSPYTDCILGNRTLGNELAKGGSGDVLSGIITALAVNCPNEELGIAVALAAEIHRRTAHEATNGQNERSILASDVVDELGKYLKNVPEE